MKIEISPKSVVASGSFGPFATSLALRLEGRKTWNSHSRLTFETSQHNISLFLSFWPDSEVEDKRGEDFSAFDIPSEAPEPVPQFVMPPRDFQLENFNRFKNQAQWAIFSEQGTGKTKVAIDIICHRFLRGTLTGVIVFSSPKGVHSQWIEEQFPKHLWPSVHLISYIWDGKKEPRWIGTATPDLQIISGNIDMLKSEKGFSLLSRFAESHGDRLLVLVDESDSIKNISAQRSKKLRELAKTTGQRAIMTGTPIAKDLTDEWAQFYFLNPSILGHKYLSTFRAEYCVMGGFENRAVVGHRNVDKFKEKTAPYIFRATKADLNLPPKVYDDVVFDLTSEQKAMIKEIKTQFFASLGDSGTVSVKNGATAILRIQQITNGFTINEDGQLIVFRDNPRLDALVNLRRDIQDKVIVWCRFQEDVHQIRKRFPDAVTIYGPDSSEIRHASKEEFINGPATELIATPGAAGKGIDGLQRVCSTAIYYSNSFNAIDRWQSEDRIDRIGMKGTSTYFDLIGRGSVDRSIIANLKRKKDISSLALGDIVKIMEEM